MIHLFRGNAKTLRQITLQGCKRLHDGMFDPFTDDLLSLPRLEYLDLTWVDNVTENMLRSMSLRIQQARLIGYYGDVFTQGSCVPAGDSGGGEGS